MIAVGHPSRVGVGEHGQHGVEQRIAYGFDPLRFGLDRLRLDPRAGPPRPPPAPQPRCVPPQILISWSHAGRLRSEAAFAALAGVSPLDASSGAQQRHRLNRHGDRALNSALHTIAVTRERCDPCTKTYIERRVSEGKTRREARRMLKRYLARHIYRHLERAAATAPAEGASLAA